MPTKSTPLLINIVVRIPMEDTKEENTFEWSTLKALWAIVVFMMAGKNESFELQFLYFTVIFS